MATSDHDSDFGPMPNFGPLPTLDDGVLKQLAADATRFAHDLRHDEWFIRQRRAFEEDLARRAAEAEAAEVFRQWLEHAAEWGVGEQEARRQWTESAVARKAIAESGAERRGRC
jgi:DNA-binding SARP family transcriptional activator